MRTDWFRKTGFTAAGLVGLTLVLGSTGCKSNSSAPIVDTSATNDASDPADANFAPVNGAAAPVYTSTQQPARVLGQQSQGPPPQATGETYPDQQAGSAYDQDYDQDQAAVDAGQQTLYADQAPPPLPEYQQPELTEPGYEWTPGYWSYAPTGYYWVPGVWVAPPFVGALWTPGYWGFYSGRYRFRHGFWGSHIGFYGGINYGFGYTGSGYHGGYWQGNNFYYNRQVNRVNTTVVRNVYEHNVTIVNNTRVSYNGPQGVNARPSAADVAVYHGRVVPAMQVQVQHAQAAAGNRQQFYAANQGRPAETVMTQRLAADRNPPPAIRPAPEVRQQAQPVNGGRPGMVNQPVQNGRPEQVQPRDQPRQQPQGGPQRPQELNQPQRPVQPQQERGVQAQQPNVRSQPAPQVRPTPEQRPQQVVRPEAQPQPQRATQPQPQREPRQQQREPQQQQREPQQQQRAPQEQQAHPQPQPQHQHPQQEQQHQAQPRPQAPPQQARPEQQPHPQQESHPAPAPAPHPPAPPREEHPKG